MNNPQKKQGRGGAQLVLLMMVFGLPVIAAWILYFNPDLLPGGRTNKGTLIQPVQPIPDRLYTTLDGSVVAKKDFSEGWSLLYVGGEHCGEPCRTRIYDMRQIRKAMAEHHDKINRLVLLDSAEQGEDFSNYLKDYSGTTIVVGESSQVMLSALQSDQAAVAGELYLVDPWGNLMMKYAPMQPAAEVLSDLELLLKVNKWGGGH